MISLRKLGAALALAASTAVASAAGYSGLYIFGDSLSDSGNIAAALGSNPGQVITGNSYIPSRPYASGQFTNGDVWAKSFATSLGLAAQPSLLGGTDFAYGGARTSTDGAGLPPSLTAQSNAFVASQGGVVSSGALYVVAGGGNDARDALAAAAASPGSAGAIIAAAASAYAASTGAIVDTLQAAGARNIIVWDVPNLALAPAVTAQGATAVGVSSFLAQSMNSALAARMAGEAGVSVFDIYGLQTQFAANPAAYGLSNVTDACGAPSAGCNPLTSLFWDGIHPTTAGHALIAQQMLITAVPEPGTYLLLGVGLLVVGWRARRRA